MPYLQLFLLMLAIVLFVVGGFAPWPDTNPWKNRLICLGLAAFAASFLRFP